MLRRGLRFDAHCSTYTLSCRDFRAIYDGLPFDDVYRRRFAFTILMLRSVSASRKYAEVFRHDFRRLCSDTEIFLASRFSIRAARRIFDLHACTASRQRFFASALPRLLTFRLPLIFMPAPLSHGHGRRFRHFFLRPCRSARRRRHMPLGGIHAAL